MTTAATRAHGGAAAAALVVVGLVVQEIGASVAVLVIPSLGALGIVALRLVYSAAILLVVARPRLRGRTRADWLAVGGFALALAAMNATFYEAIARIPLGAAVTIELLGPLVLSVVLGRRLLTVLWVVVAFGGVVLLGASELAHLDPLGVLFAALAAGCWAGYILGSRAAGRRFDGMQGLALATALAAVLSLPLGIATSGIRLIDPRWLALGLVVALCSSAIPYAIDLVALRRLSAATFGVLMSLLPAVATLAGVLVLNQPIGPLGIAAIGLVIVASIGSVLGAPRPAPLSEEPAPS